MLVHLASNMSFPLLLQFLISVIMTQKNIYLIQDGAGENRLHSKTHTGTAKQWYLTTIIIFKQEHEIERGFYNRKEN